MRLATLLLVAAALVPSVHAQTEPDTTAPWRYFPLEVGNRWEFFYQYAAAPPLPQTPYPPLAPREYWRWRVDAAVVSGGLRYFALRRERYGLNGAFLSAQTAYVRYDTAQAVVVQQGGSPFEYAPCPLDLPFYHHGGCAYGPSNGVGYGQPVLGVPTSLKQFDNGLIGGWVQLAAGIGFYRYVYDYVGKGHPHEDVTLQYARVGHQRYGTPIPVLPPVVPSEPGPGAGALRISAMPNPSAGPLTLALDMPLTGAVAVEAFDVLGRRVHDDVRTLPAGAHALALDAAAWAPGPYVVRVTTADGVVSTRVVRR